MKGKQQKQEKVLNICDMFEILCISFYFFKNTVCIERERDVSSHLVCLPEAFPNSVQKSEETILYIVVENHSLNTQLDYNC